MAHVKIKMNQSVEMTKFEKKLTLEKLFRFWSNLNCENIKRKSSLRRVQIIDSRANQIKIAKVTSK